MVFLSRISFWTCLLSVLIYWDKTAMHGKYVYDDAGSVSKNVVVNGQVPWTEVFTRDFWGTEMNEAQSHKSYRPVTTLTFRLNWLYNEHYGLIGNAKEETYGFHVVNVLLHGVNTFLATESSRFLFLVATAATTTTTGGVVEDNMHSMRIAQLLTGVLFGLHPVHCEAVSNITSRGELLMAFFFFCAFLSYASALQQRRLYAAAKRRKNNQVQKQTLFQKLRIQSGIYFVPWICMTLSMFSKEQGATTLISLVFYDFIQNHVSIANYVQTMLFFFSKSKSNNQRQQQQDRGEQAIQFFLRTFILAFQTIVVVGWRYYLNGETSPDFIYDQNPAAFSEDRFTRAFSVTWVYCLYIYDTLLPIYLCPDWSGKSISLIENASDSRIVYVLVLWYLFFDCFYDLIVGRSTLTQQPQQQQQQLLPSQQQSSSEEEQQQQQQQPQQQLELKQQRQRLQKKQHSNRRIILIAFFAFIFSPFLLSSNILVRTGFMKADRVIYLPLFGFCILEALLFTNLFCGGSENNKQKSGSSNNTSWIGYVLVMLQIGIFYPIILHERNIAWSDSVILWTHSYNVNPRSHHTMYNCGYELSLQQRYKEAEKVMRPIGSPHIDGPSNTFVYSMILYNLGLCDDAHVYIDSAMDVLEEKKARGGVRNQPAMLARTESNLLVARAYCTTEDLKLQGKTLQKAVKTDPRNTYAVNQLKAYIEKMKSAELLKQQYNEYGW